MQAGKVVRWPLRNTNWTSEHVIWVKIEREIWETFISDKVYGDPADDIGQRIDHILIDRVETPIGDVTLLLRRAIKDTLKDKLP